MSCLFDGLKYADSPAVPTRKRPGSKLAGRNHLPPLVGGDSVPEDQYGEDDREELSRRGDRRAHQRVEVGDGEVDEVLPQGGGHRQPQHCSLRKTKVVVFPVRMPG